MKKVWIKPEIESLDTRLTALSTDVGNNGDGFIWTPNNGGYYFANKDVPPFGMPDGVGNGIAHS